MSERFSRIFSLAENLYSEGSPIIIKAGALLKDNETNMLIAQLKMQSISSKMIKLVKVEVRCLDSLNREIQEPIIQEYLDLAAARDSFFGSQTPIKRIGAATRAFTARVIEVGFDDNTVWTCKDDAWEPIEAQNKINALISDEDAMIGYASLFGDFAKDVLQEDRDLWICTCGEVNRKSEERCYNCNAAVAELKSIDPEVLKKEGIYVSACKLCGSNDIQDAKNAKSLFDSISDYKDAALLSKKCEERLNAYEEKSKVTKAKTKKIAKWSALISGIVIVVGLLGYFVAYPFIAQANGNYKVIINMYGIEEYKVPDGVKSIKYDAFRGCDSLKSVTIPDGVTSIGAGAFLSCNQLESVTIPDSVTSIGDSAFRYCRGLTDITIPDSVESINYGTFSYCSSLTSITIPDSVTSIGDYAFKDCTILTSITIPDSVTYIGVSAFEECRSLTSITIPDSVTSIGGAAFSGCTGLTSITIPDSVESIGGGAFSGCASLESIALPFVGGSKTATRASSSTLFGYIFGKSSYTGGTATHPKYSSSYSEETYYIPSSLKSVKVTGGKIFYGAFWGCAGLTSITIGNDVTSIGDSAFFWCTGLTSITIPDSVERIGSEAFYCCEGLTSVTIGNGVESIDERAFYHCYNLTSITIPDSVTSIGDLAFDGCTGLVSITIGNGVKGISRCAFRGCTGLTSITIPDSVKSIGSFAFDGCTGLTSVTISNGVESIGKLAFYDCTSLASITIPDSVRSIGEYALSDCVNLTTIKYRGTEEQWYSIVKEDDWNNNTGSYTITYNYTGE